MTSFRQQLHPNWVPLLNSKAAVLDEIESLLEAKEYLPDKSQVMRALNYDPLIAKVLILGQDPYPNPDDAMGLAFSVSKESKKIPASLRNIYKELASDLGVRAPEGGDLSMWSEQGVVLLNRTLTCAPGESDSHRELGWRIFTDAVVEILAARNICAILWGKSAAQNAKLFKEENLFLSAHPSPLSAHRGFFGSKPFSAVNARLLQMGESPIDWIKKEIPSG